MSKLTASHRAVLADISDDALPTGPSLPTLLRWLLGITRPVHPPLLASLVARVLNLLLDLALFAVAAGGAMSLVLDTTGNSIGATGPLILTLVILALVKSLCFYLEQFTGHFVAFKALELLRGYVFSKLWPKAPGIVTHSRSGDILTSLTRDVDRIEVVYAHSFAPIVSAYIVGPIAIVTSGVIAGWDIVWIAALCLGLSLLVVPYLGVRSSARGTEEVLVRRRELAHHASDSVFGLDEVRGYGRESDRLEELDQLGIEVSRASAWPRDITGIRRGLNVLLSLVATISIVWLGSNELSLVGVAALSVAAFRAFEGPRGIEDATGNLDHSFAAARRLYEISHAPERVTDGPDILRLEHAPAIEFRNVSYAYPGADGAGAAFGSGALMDVSLTVPAGGHAVLVGRSGAGKSTIVQLLLRYDNPAAGVITIDGQPIETFTLDSLRHAVVTVSQRNQLLSASIAANLRLGAPDASEAQLWDALEAAGLAGEIRAMPDQLHTAVGGRTATLSGGQVQRLCLARALLMHPRVLILDEFTANLDVALEQRVRSALRAWSTDMTVIEVTHRLASTREADVVYIVDRGRIVREGSPSGLTAEMIEQHFTTTV